MVKLDNRLNEIKSLVDTGNYFTINRARQYGKTTILMALEQYLNKDYYVVFIDFQMFGDAKFKDENIFSISFAGAFLRQLTKKIPFAADKRSENAIAALMKAVDGRSKNLELMELFENISAICDSLDKPVVLMIDEVDSAANNQVFLDFLAQLRAYYIRRELQSAFRSVILAGVYDVKNLKQKFRSEEEHKQNSPWNIASDFKVEMSFTRAEIADMLREYESDYNTGMDIDDIAGQIYDYTAGYPYLVSKLCKLMDEDISQMEEFHSKSAAWTREGFFAAIRIILSEKNTLFESLIGKLCDYPELNTMLRSLLFTGKSIAYNSDEPAIDIATMFGFIKNQNGIVAVANRIFETRLYNFYLSTAEMQTQDIYKVSLQDKSRFIVDGHLNMRRVLERFVIHFDDLYGDCGETFVEEDGRTYFLLYLRPIINGVGNYYIEARTRELRRTDVVVDYHGEQFIIEMKIWHGEEYHNRGEKQLVGYLDAYHANKGYMISFNFNKKKQIGVHEIVIGNKVLVEAVV